VRGTPLALVKGGESLLCGEGMHEEKAERKKKRKIVSSLRSEEDRNSRKKKRRDYARKTVCGVGKKKERKNNQSSKVQGLFFMSQDQAKLLRDQPSKDLSGITII